MYRIRNSNFIPNDIDTKRDNMSILVRARKAELDAWLMSDRAMDGPSGQSFSYLSSGVVNALIYNLLFSELVMKLPF